MKTLIFAIALGLASSAYAQTTVTEYYVVHDAEQKKCIVVDKKPTTSATVAIVDGSTVYTTRSEAEAAMKAATICQPN